MPILSGVRITAVRFKVLVLVIALLMSALPSITFAASLYVFVSMSMPKTSLQQWATQAEKIGEPLLLRGLVDNSMKKTLTAIEELELKSPSFQIAPESFEEFSIDKVPAVVVSDGKQFDVIYGDQSLQSALWQLSMKGELPLLAENYRKTLVGSADE